MVADPVVAGVLLVSLEGLVEPSVTAIAIDHEVVVVQRKEWEWNDR